MPKLKKRADGRYAMQIYLGLKADGKRNIKTVYGKTAKECQDKADTMKKQLSKGIDITNEYKTFAEWSTLFLAREKKRATPSEYRRKETNLEYICDYIGNKDIKKILPFEIEDILNDLADKNPYTNKPSSRKTIVNYLSVCSQVFKFAIKTRITDYNPCNDCELPPDAAEKKERRALTEQERQYIDTCKGVYRLPSLLACYCGLRKGEITALERRAVNFEKRTISVYQSYDFKNKRIKPPKTKAGYRNIPLPDIVYDEIIKAPKNGKYLCNINGNMLSDYDWKRMLADLLYDYNQTLITDSQPEQFTIYGRISILLSFDPYDWHCMRHTYCTLLYEAGVDVYTAKTLMGHSDIATTYKIYTHLSEQKKAKSIDKFNNFIKNLSSQNSSQDMQKPLIIKA